MDINNNAVKEELLFESKPNSFAEKVEFILSASFACIFVCVFFVFLPLIIGREITFELFILPSIISCFVSVGLYSFLYNDFQQRCKKNKVRITNKKIIFYDKKCQAHVKVPLREIRNFYVKQDFLDKKLNCADIKINTDVDSYWVNNINEFRDFYFIIKENTRAFVEPIIVDGRDIKCKIEKNEKIIWEGKYNKILSFIFIIISVIVPLLLLVMMAISSKDIKMTLCISGFLLASLSIITAAEYPYLKNFKKTYYVITNKRILFCNKDTDGVCRIIPLETINDCYVYKPRKGERRLRIMTDRKDYEFFDFGDMCKIEDIVNKFSMLRKREIIEEENISSNI